MPTRVLRDGILESERVDRLSCAGEIFYRRLMSAADDHGRYHAKPELLLARLYPLRVGKVTLDEIASWLSECEREQLVRVYTTVGAKRFLEILDFRQQKRAASKFPAPVAEQTLSACTAVATQTPDRQEAFAHLGVGVGGGVVEGGGGGGAAHEPPAGCPVEKIVDLYHETLPDNPKCMALSDTRRRHIRARWDDWRRQGKYSDIETGLAWWRKWFVHAGESAFLTGRAPPRPGRDPFVADIDFLMGAEKNLAITEGKYHDSAGIAA